MATRPASKTAAWRRWFGRQFDAVWHRRLGRPYHLALGVDQGDARATPVVLLHGLGRSFEVWSHLVSLLEPLPYHVLAFDLLGFGESPKPKWLDYTVDDHAAALIASLERQRLQQPAIMVGHSMGCLVAIRVARLRPDLVRHLILYEMPLYAGLPDKRRYRLRLNVYFSLYKRIIAFKPQFGGGKTPRGQRLAERFIGYKLRADTWLPFIRSLQHTIMEQTTHLDIKELPMPVDVIYGTKDRVVIRGRTTEIFGEDKVNITGHTVRESHGITQKGSQFLVRRIRAVGNG